MKWYFGANPIKEWIDGDGRKQNFPDHNNLTDNEKQEIKKSLDQEAIKSEFFAFSKTR